MLFIRVGALTGGGDRPGLNAVIRAIVRKGVQEYGYEFTGFRDGRRGPLDGTVLGSSRTHPLKAGDGVRRIGADLAERGVDALIVIGAEDTLGVASDEDERAPGSSRARRTHGVRRPGRRSGRASR